MTRMTAAERRALLVEAAIVVMSRDGVARTTTRAVVAEAGMQIGVFHYCFRSKDELILEVMHTIGRRSLSAVAEVLARSTDTAELLRLASRAFWTHIEAHPLERLLVFELTHYALRQPGQEEAAAAQYAGYQAGTDPELDQAVALVPKIYAALRQDPGDPQSLDAFLDLANALRAGG